MKRFVIILLALCMALLTGCGAPFTDGATDTAPQTQESISGEDASALGSESGMTISEDGVHTLSGAVKGQVLVTAKTVTLVLDSADITCSKGAAILGDHDGGRQELTIELRGSSSIASAKGHGVHGKDDVIITGSGAVKISAVKDGIHAGDALTVAGGDIRIEKSNEGIEAVNVLVSGGSLAVHTEDDGINAAAGGKDTTPGIAVTGGTVQIFAGSDGLDSNGTLDITGGTVAVFVAALRDGDATDTDLGGTIQPAVYGRALIPAGAAVAVGDVWRGTVEADATAFCICAPGLKEGQRYTVTVNGVTQVTAEATATIQSSAMVPAQ